MAIITVADIFSYPIKSGKPNALTKANLTKDGVSGDRGWMVIGENGAQITAREAPILLLVEAYELSNRSIKLCAPGCTPTVGLHTQDERDATLFNTSIKVADAGTAAADWLTKLIGQPARLVQYTANTQRPYGTSTYDRFGDIAPVLIVNKSSLDALNAQLPHSIEMDRFRPNIVLENALAHAEDNWDELIIGNTILKVIEPCARCVLTTIDPISGRRELSQEPLRALSRYRATDAGKIHFGVYAHVIKFGNVKRYDEVQIKHQSTPRLYNIQKPLESTAADRRVLRLTHTVRAADDARHLWWRFDDNHPTQITPGQFVSLRVPQPDGTQLARSFTISDQREDGREIRLSVRQQGDGGVSDYLVNSAKEGDTIWATGVHGDFVMQRSSTSTLFISAGSGVTPFLAFISQLNDKSDVHHIHLDKTPERAIDIELLKHTHATLTGYNLRTQWTKYEGRLQISQFADIPNLHSRKIWICGPNAFVENTKEMLKTLKIQDESIQFETFAAPEEGHATNKFHTVTLDDGTPIKVDAGITLLSALRAAGQTLASSCEMGSCQSCMLRLIEGTCHETTDRKQVGCILPCTSFARSDLRLARLITNDKS